MSFLSKLESICNKLDDSEHPELTLLDIYAVFNPEFSQSDGFNAGEIIAQIDKEYAQCESKNKSQAWLQELVHNLKSLVLLLKQYSKVIETTEQLEEVNSQVSETEQKIHFWNEQLKNTLLNIDDLEAQLKELYLSLKPNYYTITNTPNNTALPAETFYSGQIRVIEKLERELKKAVAKLESLIAKLNIANTFKQHQQLLHELKSNHNIENIADTQLLKDDLNLELSELELLIALFKALENQTTALFNNQEIKTSTTTDNSSLEKALITRIDDAEKKLKSISKQLKAHPLSESEKSSFETKICHSLSDEGENPGTVGLRTVNALLEQYNLDLNAQKPSSYKFLSLLGGKKESASNLKEIQAKINYLTILQQREQLHEVVHNLGLSLKALASDIKLLTNSIPESDSQEQKQAALCAILKLSKAKIPNSIDWRNLPNDIDDILNNSSTLQEKFPRLLPLLIDALTQAQKDKHSELGKISTLNQLEKAIQKFCTDNQLCYSELEELVTKQDKNPSEIGPLQKRLSKYKRILQECELYLAASNTYYVKKAQTAGLQEKVKILAAAQESLLRERRKLNDGKLNSESYSREKIQELLTKIKWPSKKKTIVTPQPLTTNFASQKDLRSSNETQSKNARKIDEQQFIPIPSTKPYITMLDYYYENCYTSVHDSQDLVWLRKAYLLAWQHITSADLRDPSEQVASNQLINFFIDISSEKLAARSKLIAKYRALCSLDKNNLTIHCLNPVIRFKPIFLISDALLSKPIEIDEKKNDQLMLEIRDGLALLKQQTEELSSENNNQAAAMHQIYSIYQYASQKSLSEKSANYVSDLDNLLEDPKYDSITTHQSLLGKLLEGIAKIITAIKNLFSEQEDSHKNCLLFFKPATHRAVDSAHVKLEVGTSPFRYEANSLL
jgi:hypothetical protein